MDEVMADQDPIADHELERFKTDEVQFLAEFANGKPSRQEFEAIFSGSLFQDASLKDMVIASWSPYQLLWLIFGIGSAYKLAYNRSETEDV